MELLAVNACQWFFKSWTSLDKKYLLWHFVCCCLVSKSCLIPLWPHGLQPTRLLCPRNFPGKNTGVGPHFLLQGILPTPGLNLFLLCWQVDLPRSHLEAPFDTEAIIFFVDCTYFEVNHSGILIVLVLQWLYVNLSVSITNNRNQSSTGKEFMVAQLVKNPPAKAGDMGSIPRSGRSPGEGHGNHCLKWCFKWYFGA